MTSEQNSPQRSRGSPGLQSRNLRNSRFQGSNFESSSPLFPFYFLSKALKDVVSSAGGSVGSPKKTAMIRLAEKPHCLPPTSFQSCHRSQAWSLSKREVGCGWLHMGMLNAEQLFFMTSGMLLNRTDSYGSSSMCPCSIYPPPPSVVACATPATHTLHMQISQICQDQHCPTSSAGEVPIPRLFT